MGRMSQVVQLEIIEKRKHRGEQTSLAKGLWAPAAVKKLEQHQEADKIQMTEPGRMGQP